MHINYFVRYLHSLESAHAKFCTETSDYTRLGWKRDVIERKSTVKFEVLPSVRFFRTLNFESYHLKAREVPFFSFPPFLGR